MSSTRGSCPGCGLLVTIDGPQAITCPICSLTCSPAALDAVNPAAARESSPPASTPAALQRQVRLGAAGIATVAFLTLGLLWAYQNAPRAASPPAAAVAETPPPSIPEPNEAPETPADSPPPPPPSQPQPVTPPQPTPARQEPAGDALEDRLAHAMERGLAYLKRCRARGRTDGLLGLTLLECGVPASDAQVQELAQNVRSQKEQLHNTYDLGLAILFLARLGEAQDRALIRSFALRLAAGQNGDGAWSYDCPVLDAAGERKAEAELRALRFTSPDTSLALNLLATPLPPPPQPRAPLRSGARPGLTWAGEPTILGPHGPLQTRQGSKPSNGRALYVAHPPGDHSNTQFALLGLWTARHLGVPTDWALRRAAYHFRSVVAPGGFWGYYSSHVSAQGHPFTASSTCAGLLALAMDYGLHFSSSASLRIMPAAPVNDPTITTALRYLGEVLAGRHRGSNGQLFTLRRPLLDVDARGDLYFLWSLERVAVIYEIDRFGGRDWYLWAAPRLVEAQQADGSWHDAFPGVIDTCFAMLALQRSNVAPDLTDALHGVVHTGQGKPVLQGGTVRPSPRPPLQGTTAPAAKPKPALEGTIVAPPAPGK